MELVARYRLKHETYRSVVDSPARTVRRMNPMRLIGLLLVRRSRMADEYTWIRLRRRVRLRWLPGNVRDDRRTLKLLRLRWRLTRLRRVICVW